MHISSPSADPALLPEPATAEEAVMSAMVRVGKRLRHRIPGEQIDFASLPLLKTLHHCGAMRLTTLAQALDLDASTVSRHARSLEDRGLLERTDDPDDKRASRVAVSAYGAECLQQGAAHRRALIADALADWSAEDREVLRVLLHRLVVDLTNHPLNDPSEETS